jgi:hypothetical protein
MKILFLILLGSLLFSSCRKDEKEILTKEEKYENPIDTVQGEITIIDESFIDKPFQFGEVTEDKLKQEFKNLEIKAEPIKNLHVRNQVDSILTITINNSEFILYKLPKEQFLESAVIKDGNIVLGKDIHVGMTKDQFKDKFDDLKDRKYIPSKISVGRKETQEYLVFTFKDNKLKEIEYNGYVD